MITRMELLSYPGITTGEEERIRRFLDGVLVIPLSETIETTVIAMRRVVRLKLPDAIIAATALAIGATLITCDQRLCDMDWPGFHAVTPA